MVESSKILTVSYGTFSCTLEGFDDSFSTMKAIAEYFRDLAAGDRYFGAEPPTPDAEMMAKIAQSQVAQHVEATSDDNGIVLRAAAAVLPIAEPETVEVETAAPTMPPMATPPAEEDVAAVAEQLPEEISTEEVETIDVAAPEAGEDISPLLVAESAATPEFDAEIVDEMDVDGVSSFEDMAPLERSEAPAHPDADSVAAKLQRIRAVVGGGMAAIPTTPDLEDQTEPFELAEEFEVASTEEINDDDAETSFEEEDQVSVEETALDIDVDEVEEQAEELVADQSDAREIEAVEDESIEELQEDVTAALEEEADAPTLEVFEEEDTFEAIEEVAYDETEVEEVLQAEEDISEEFEAVVEAEALEDSDDDVYETEENSPVEIDSALIASIANASNDYAASEPQEEELAAEDEENSDDTTPEKLSFTARILRAARPGRKNDDEDVAEDATDVKMDDVISAIEGSAEDVTEELDVAANDGADDLTEFNDIPVGELSPEDEAALQDELAEVTQEIDAQNNETRQNRHALPENDDASMTRIMDQTDQELSEPEGNRRREAIAQLKAAVAATEAGRQLGEKDETAAEAESDFREDLDQVVRPRRADRLPRTEVRKERPRPAPLKLVASQRIDEGAEPQEEQAPVSPRRIATADEVAEDASNFAEFAAEMGASELPDLLEAAAAYTSFVEGNEDFSRPQIMKKVQLSVSEGFSREDGLRTFGTLLREGRISKVRNGRFQVSDQTRFKPEQRAS